MHPFPRSTALLAAGAVVAGLVAAGVGAPATAGKPISQKATTALLSTGLNGAVPDGVSANPEFSRDGRYVVFTSEATNLVAGDTNGVRDVFRRDQWTGRTILVSRADGAGGALGDGPSGGAMIGGMNQHGISADGRYVVFSSDAENLVAGDHPAWTDVFVRDVVRKRTYLVSRNNADAGLVGGTDPSGEVDISADGRYVVFDSSATNLPSTQGGTVRQVYRRDLRAGRTLLVSQNTIGAAGTSDSQRPVVSDDGTKVGFVTLADNLGATQDSMFAVRDIARERTTIESRLAGPQGAKQTSFGGAISGDGTHIGWTDGNGSEFYVRNLRTGATQDEAVLTNGDPLPGFCCYEFELSDDARYVASYAGDDDWVAYVRDRTTDVTRVVSRPDGASSTPQPSELSAGIGISGNGRFIGFGSTAGDLDTGDFDGPVVFPADVFVRDLTGPPRMRVRLDVLRPARVGALRARIGCGDAFCDAVVTGRVVLQRTARGDGKRLLDLARLTTYLPGATTRTVRLRLAEGDLALDRVRQLLDRPGYRRHSLVRVRLWVRGERGAASEFRAVRLRP